MRFSFAQLGLVIGLAVLPLASQAVLTDSGLTTGPYVQRISKHAATVMVHSDASQTIDLYYRRANSSNQWKRKREGAGSTSHRYRLTNLRRGRSYEYYLRDSSGNRLTQTYTFTTQRSLDNDNPLRVAVLGDSGLGTTTQYEVAMEMASWNPDLLLHTGDIVYNSGTEQEFIDKFFTVYSNLLPEVPFYGSIGNHDYTTEQAGPYKAFFETPRNGNNEDYYSFNYENVHFVSLNTNLDFSVGSTMYEWLENDLTDTNKQWIIVFFHHPVYSSSGTHGSTAGMAEALVPLFEEHNVDLVLNGHDHSYERFEKTNGVTYIVTGGGGATTYAMGTQLDNSVYYLAENHFLGLTINYDELNIKAIDEDGFVFDQITLE